jgi:hypothetical protein
MLICNPPVKRAKVSIECCASYAREHDNDDPNLENYPSRETNITSGTGLTVGDILSAAERFRHRHRLCAFAKEVHHDKAGYVATGISFILEVSFAKGDPYVATKFAEQSRRAAEATGKREKNQLSKYIEHKRIGKIVSNV